MPSKLRSYRPSHATVVAYLALFVALGGSSYAAIKVTGKNVPKDALTGADIKNLTGKDVRNNSLTGADTRNLTGRDVVDGSLLAQDFASGQLPRGAKGDKGDKGDQGDRGEQGEDGVTGAPGSARAHGVLGPCPDIPDTFDACQVTRNKEVAYAVRVATGVYCVGVNNAAPAQDVAIVTVDGSPANLTAAWRSVNSACVASEFEIYTRSGATLSNDPGFTLTIP